MMFSQCIVRVYTKILHKGAINFDQVKYGLLILMVSPVYGDIYFFFCFHYPYLVFVSNNM